MFHLSFNVTLRQSDKIASYYYSVKHVFVIMMFLLHEYRESRKIISQHDYTCHSVTGL